MESLIDGSICETSRVLLLGECSTCLILRQHQVLRETVLGFSHLGDFFSSHNGSHLAHLLSIFKNAFVRFVKSIILYITSNVTMNCNQLQVMG